MCDSCHPELFISSPHPERLYHNFLRPNCSKETVCNGTFIVKIQKSRGCWLYCVSVSLSNEQASGHPETGSVHHKHRKIVHRSSYYLGDHPGIYRTASQSSKGVLFFQVNESTLPKMHSFQGTVPLSTAAGIVPPFLSNTNAQHVRRLVKCLRFARALFALMRSFPVVPRDPAASS